MKKVLLLMFVVCLLFICTLSVNAADEIKVMVDERTVEFDQPPVLMNDRTLVPVRAIFEKLGAKVDWNSETRTVTATKDDITISLQIDNEEMNVNSDGQSKKITLDQPPVIINNRTLVPVRAISEAFGAGVEWWPNTKTVAIDSDGVYESKVSYFYDGRLYFNVSVRKTDAIYNANTCQIYIWDGNEVAKIAAPDAVGPIVVKGDYIFYSSKSPKTDRGKAIYRVKTDGTEHRMIYASNKDYDSSLWGRESKFFIDAEKIYVAEMYENYDDDEYSSVLFSMDYDGRQLKKTEVKEYGGLWDFWVTNNAAYLVAHYGSGGKSAVKSNDVTIFEISLNDSSIKEIKTITGHFSALGYADKVDRETFEVIEGSANYTLGEVCDWTYYTEEGDLYRKNKKGETEFVCQGGGILFNDFIVQEYNDYDSYNFKTRSYTVEVMDLDGLNPQTIYFYSDNSNFNANSNITDLSATGTPQDCGICGGAGRIECNVCDGSGKVRDYSYSVSSLRDEDGDERYRHCSFCNGGRKDCLGCGGDGRIHD